MVLQLDESMNSSSSSSTSTSTTTKTSLLAPAVSRANGDNGIHDHPHPHHDDDDDEAAPSSSCIILQTLHRLDEEYSRLSSKEIQIQNYMNILQQEEVALRNALELSSTSLKEQRISERKRKEVEALARLEEALMIMDDDDESDESGSSDMDGKDDE